MVFRNFGKHLMSWVVSGLSLCLVSATIAVGQNLPSSDKRVGIVYSQATASRYWDITAFSQLFMVAQHQTMMAGIPFDLLTEDDLTNINKLAHYDAIIFPYFSNVTQSKLNAIQNALTQAVSTYHVGLVAGGEFMTMNESGAGLADYQARMNNLLGVQINSWSSNVNATIRADVVAHPAMKGYAPDEQISQYTGLYFPNVVPFNNPNAQRLAKWVKADNTTGNAMLATHTGGRNVFFANEQILADSNLLWQAIQWVVYGNDVPVGLKMTRFNNILTSRTDMDQTGYEEDVTSVGQPLYTLLSQWKNNFNFSNTLHINVAPEANVNNTTGLNAWLSLHQQYMALGHEIGTHSWSHPQDTGTLTQSQLEFEFNQSKNVIGQQLGINVVGTAIPGNAEPLSVDQQVSQYFSYISGRYGFRGSGYGTSIGFLDPSYTTIYYNMNFKPDFTLLSFENKTPAQAEQEWKDAYAYINLHGSQPICHWMWHDYGPTFGPNGDGNNYTPELYTNTIANFYNGGSEFATQADVTDRIKIFRDALTSLQVTPGQTPNDINVHVAQNNVGKFELLINTNQVIKNVDNWYAYNQKGVFLKKDGGTYNIHLGAAQDKLTHISSLPMRAELISVSGTGTELEFSFNGQGNVIVELNVSSDTPLIIEGADSSIRNGDTLTLTFNQLGLHTAKVLVQDSNNPPQVSLTSPANNALFTSPANINLQANASDSDGSIAKVEFFNGVMKLGEDTSSPYSFDWNNVSVGNYSLTAKATDNTGLFTSSSVINIIINELPIVILITPVNNTVFTAPATVNFEATASDIDGTIAKVEFFNGVVKLGEDLTAPYSFIWNDVSSGNYVLTAKATDNNLATNTSTAVNISVNGPPIVNLTNPVNNTVFLTPSDITLEAAASDDGIVSQVEFFDGNTSLGVDATNPYSLLWSGASVGNHILTAKATDSQNLSATSSAVNIVVNAAPTVALTAPAEGAIFTAPAVVTIEATASDTNGTISKVEFFNGAIKLEEDATAPYSFVWNNVSAGSYSLTAKATDNHGSMTTSNAVNITVNPGTTPPVEATYVSIANEDGWVRESTETSNVGGTIGATGTGNLAIRMGDNPTDRQFKSILSFDTSTIPDGATILSATLQLTRGGTVGDDPFTTHGTCYVDIKNGGFNNNTALENADFQAIANAQQVATITKQGESLTVYTVNISDAALNQVNKIGKTQLRLYFLLDDNDNEEDDYAGFYSGDNSNAGRRPKLVVKYQP